MTRFLIILWWGIFAFSVSAQQIITKERTLSDPILEQKAQNIFIQLRCVVCQGQSVGDSDAQLARDFRNITRDLLIKGKNEQEILDFFHQRYGDFVLLSPPLKNYTLLLWLSPFIIFIITIIMIVIWYKRYHITLHNSELFALKQQLATTEYDTKNNDDDNDQIIQQQYILNQKIKNQKEMVQDKIILKKPILLMSFLTIIVISFIISGISYYKIGRPNLPDQPLQLRYEQAEQVLIKAINDFPDNIHVRLTYARFLRQLGKNNHKIISLMHDIITIDPYNQEALWFLALDALQHRDKGKARDFFERFLTQVPKDSPQYKVFKNNIDDFLK